MSAPACQLDFGPCSSTKCRRHRKIHDSKVKVHPVVRRGIKLSVFVLVAHFVMHYGWYAFEGLWVETLGLPNPRELGKNTSQLGVPLTVVLIAAAAWLQRLFE
jgi:hypothetical protein